MWYRVLTIGSTPASEELTKAFCSSTSKKSTSIHDDTIATAKEKEHKIILKLALKIIEESEMTLNINKCMFHHTEAPFWEY